MRNKKKLLQTSEQKLTELLGEMNAEKRPDKSDKLVCETEITMARIRSYSDILYALKMKPWQTACYYAAAVLFLMLCAAVWTREWLLTVIFAALFLVCATLPHNMRISYFNKNADALEGYYGKELNIEFADDKLIVSELIPRAPENADDKTPRTPERTVELDYKKLTAIECVHSFYIFPEKSETLICDKTLFLCGTPMGARDILARKLGRRFKIKTKIK